MAAEMTHVELVFSMKETLRKMCHSSARVAEFAFKVNRNKEPLSLTTPTSKAVYVVKLDRELTKLGWA